MAQRGDIIRAKLMMQIILCPLSIKSLYAPFNNDVIKLLQQAPGGNFVNCTSVFNVLKEILCWLLVGALGIASRLNKVG